MRRKCEKNLILNEKGKNEEINSKKNFEKTLKIENMTNFENWWIKKNKKVKSKNFKVQKNLKIRKILKKWIFKKI